MLEPLTVSLYNNTVDLMYKPNATIVPELIAYLTAKTGFSFEVEHAITGNVLRFELHSPRVKVDNTLKVLKGHSWIIHCELIERDQQPLAPVSLVEYDPDVTGPRDVRDMLRESDIDAVIWDQSNGKENASNTEARFWLKRFITSTIFCVPILIFVWAIPHVPANITIIKSLHLWTLLNTLFGGIIETYVAAPIHRAAWITLIRQHKVEMDMLVSPSTSVAYIYSLIVTIISALETFYETAALLVTLILLGRCVTVYARGKASDAVLAFEEDAGEDSVID
ncbi:hypothetical protein HDV00_012154 [Rhizophlyctis rosea]|nr:hypothetical protein HDV00_012154 [Rhizophlyctis rosea]